MTKPSVLIVGAGISGLAAGTWLRAKGHPVQLIEAADRPGGRAVTIERPDGSGDMADTGSQYFHSNYRRARALIAEAGLAPDLRRVRGRTRFFDARAPGGTFTTGHRVPYIRALGSWANLRLIAMGLARMLRNPISPYGLDAWPRLDALPAARAMPDLDEWTYTARTLIAAGALVEPDDGEISYLQLIRLMRIVLMTDYLVLDGGIATLHGALAARLDIAYGAPARLLIWQDSRARGIEMADGTRHEAEHVIVAVPPQAAAGMLPADWVEERGFLQGIRQPPAAVVTLWLDRPLEPGIWSYVLPASQDALVSFCTDAAQKNPAMVPSGRAALQAWICWPASERAMALDDAGLIAAVTEELAPRFPGLAGRIQATHVQRHAQAVPQSPPGHAGAARAFLVALDRRAGVEICGDFLSGGYMECALWSAERAVARITGV